MINLVMKLHNNNLVSEKSYIISATLLIFEKWFFLNLLKLPDDYIIKLAKFNENCLGIDWVSSKKLKISDSPVACVYQIL